MLVIDLICLFVVGTCSSIYMYLDENKFSLLFNISSLLFMPCLIWLILRLGYEVTGFLLFNSNYDFITNMFQFLFSKI